MCVCSVLPFSPYELPPHSPRLDDTPEHGLHGYQLHVDMHSGGVFCLCSTFRDLFTKKGDTSLSFCFSTKLKGWRGQGPVFTWELRTVLLTGHSPSIGTVSSQTPVHSGTCEIPQPAPSASALAVAFIAHSLSAFWILSTHLC